MNLLDQLIALGEKATPGPWYAQGPYWSNTWMVTDDEDIHSGSNRWVTAQQDNCEYIAAVNPATLVPLLKAVSKLIKNEPLASTNVGIKCGYCEMLTYNDEIDYASGWVFKHADSCPWKVLSDLAGGPK